MLSAVTLLVATAVAVQAASSNPYIPSDISSGCSTFLDTLNSDTDLPACTKALITATSAYGPGGSSGSASKAAVSSTLDTVCASTACPSSLIAGKLAAFYTACSAELTSSPSTEVKTIYDTFYALLPLVGALCSKDDTGASCAFSAPASGAAAALEPALAVKAAGSVVRRDGTTTAAFLPNATTIAANRILFLFLDGTLPKAQLCTTCTRNILSSYISFESKTTYAPGLAQSVLMPGQSDIYSGVVSTCGADFMTSAVKAAGGLGQGTGTGSSGALSLRAGGALAVLAGSVGAAALLL